MASSRNNAQPDRLLTVIDDTLRRYLPVDAASQRLLVGLSGGRDSVALLHALWVLQPSWGYSLAACHVHHGLSVHADAWLSFCRQLCTACAIPLKAVHITVPPNAPEGLEAAARARRYEVFAASEADWLILAQHRHDQAETLLFNLLRSGGVHGARAMPEVRLLRQGLSVLRPLLSVSRDSLEAYLQKNALQWVDDESNADLRWSRNYLRHRVMPALRERFPAADACLARAAGRFAEAADLLDDLARLDAGAVPLLFPFPVAGLSSLPEARARNLLRYLLSQQGVMIPSEARLREGLRQILQAKSDRHPSVMLGAWRLFRRKNTVCLEKTLENRGEPSEIKLK